MKRTPVLVSSATTHVLEREDAAETADDYGTYARARLLGDATRARA